MDRARRRRRADYLRPTAAAGCGQLHHPLHFGVCCDSDGDRAVCTAAWLGLYGACLIGNVPIEQTVKADPGLSRIAAAVPVGDRLRARISTALRAPSAIDGA